MSNGPHAAAVQACCISRLLFPQQPNKGPTARGRAPAGPRFLRRSDEPCGEVPEQSYTPPNVRRHLALCVFFRGVHTFQLSPSVSRKCLLSLRARRWFAFGFALHLSFCILFEMCLCHHRYRRCPTFFSSPLPSFCTLEPRRPSLRSTRSFSRTSL